MSLGSAGRGRRWRAQRATRFIIIIVALAPFAAGWAMLRSERRRLAEMSAQLAIELDAERRRPIETREPLRGEARDGDVIAEVAKALAAFRWPSRVASISTFTTAASGSNQFEDILYADARPTPNGAHAAYRELLAPLVPELRAALANRRIAPRCPIDDLELADYPYENMVAAHTALYLEAVHALENGRAREAAEIATDLWRLHDDDTRAMGRIFAYAHPMRKVGIENARVIADAIPRIDDGGLVALDAALVRLLETQPSLVDRARRHRLWFGHAMSAFAENDWRPLQASGLAIPASWEKPIVRTFALRRSWERGDERLRALEEALDRAPRDATVRVRELSDEAHESWSAERYLVSKPIWIFSESVGEVALLRILRVLIRAEKFRRASARLPASLDELGAPIELDPFDGAPLRSATANDIIKVWSIGPDLQDDGGGPLSEQPDGWHGDVALELGPPR